VKLHSPAFSKALRGLLREARRASPALRRAMRRQRRRRTLAHQVPVAVWRLFFPLGAALLMLRVARAGLPLEADAAIVSIWFLWVSIVGSTVVRTQAARLPPALLNLPFAPADFTRLSRRRVLGLLWRPCADALMLFVVLAGLQAGGPLVWAAVPLLAGVCGVAVWAATVWLARFPPPRALQSMMAMLPLALIMGLQSHGVRVWLGRVLAEDACTLMLLSPGGWLAAAYLAGLGVLASPWILGAVPAVVLAASATYALATLLRHADAERELLTRWLGMRTEDAGFCDDEGESLSAAPVPPPAPDLAAVWQASLVAGASPGWIERVFLGWLGDRERLVLACITARVPSWTRLTRRSAQFLTFGVVLAWIGRWVPLGWHGLLVWVYGMALVIGLAIGLPLASGFDQLTGRASIYGLQVARVAMYPMRPIEFVRLTVKAALLRAGFMLPVVAVAGAALAVPWHVSPWALALGGAKLVFLSAAAAPCLCILALSAVSNDTQARFWRGGCLAGALIGGVLALLGLAAATLFAPAAWGCVAVVCFAAVAWGVAWTYVRAYDRGVFDLVRHAQG